MPTALRAVSAAPETAEARTGAPQASAGTPGAGQPRASDLPAPPQAAMRVLQLCADPGADARRVAAVVEQDPALAAQVLRIVNSAFFGFARQVGSVRHAVSILGQKPLRNYVLCLAVRDALRPAVLHGLDTTRFWDASLRRAVAGRALAPSAGVDPDTAFTVCLLQDMGLLAMVHARPDCAGVVGALLELDPERRLAREQATFATTHDAAGRDLARAWELPEDLAQAIGEHHAEPGDAAHGSALGRVALCADWAAAVFQTADTRHVIARTRALCAKHLALAEADADAVLGTIGERVADAGRALGVKVQACRSFDEVLRDAHLALAEENLGYQELAWRLQSTLDEREALSRRLRDEVEKARLVQRALMPPPGEQTLFHGINAPARELSGDFFDFFPAADGRWCFNLGDVSGKGVDAALLMSKTSSLFRCLGKRLPDPGRLLGLLNDELCEPGVRGMFVTMIAGVLDPRSGEICLANAGHPPAVLVDSSGRTREVEAGAPPLGVADGTRYPVERHAMRGGTLWLYSDGMLEAAQGAAPASGLAPLLALIAKVARAPVAQRPARLVNALSRPGQPAADDLTVLMVDGTAAR